MGRCTATSQRSGVQCKKAAILGGNVCPTHGGSAPQVREKARQRLALAHITPDRTLLEIARIAYSDVASFFNADGSIKKPSELNEDQRGALAGFEAVIKNTEAGDGQTDLIHKFKAWDKTKALEMLAKHFGLMNEKVEHDVAIKISWLTQPQ